MAPERTRRLDQLLSTVVQDEYTAPGCDRSVTHPSHTDVSPIHRIIRSRKQWQIHSSVNNGRL